MGQQNKPKKIILTHEFWSWLHENERTPKNCYAGYDGLKIKEGIKYLNYFFQVLSLYL